MREGSSVNKTVVNNRRLGNNYERLAGKYLEAQGYQILEYNFYSRIGEIDIVALHEGYLVFLEVKYRKDKDKGHPLEAVSVRKQQTICRCALYYMKKKDLSEMPVRFDVVGILGEQIQLVQNAFEFIL